MSTYPLTQGRLSRADISVCIISLILIHLSTTKLQLITLPLHECNFTVLRGKEKLHVGIVKMELSRNVQSKKPLSFKVLKRGCTRTPFRIMLRGLFSEHLHAFIPILKF